MATSNNVAYTAAINPPSATTKLELQHIWPLLQRKIRRAQDFVGAAITATEVLEVKTTDDGHRVTSREVVFREGNRRVHEDCVEYEPMRVEFRQPDGSRIQNIVSEGAGGELYMTYAFEWRHPELAGDAAALAEKLAKEKKMAQVAVEETLKAMRAFVAAGTWEEDAE